MFRFRKFGLRSVPLFLIVAGAAPMCAEFAPVSEAERTLTEVPGRRGAPAVVLFKRAEFWMMDPSQQISVSRLRVEERIKVLTEEGKNEYGEVEIAHSRALRLSSFEGRTVLPDGREIPLAKDAVFERRTSRAEKTFITTAAFPGVEVGAILDYHYEIRFDSLLYLEPWFFQERIPTLLSEITYYIPSSVGTRSWGRAESVDAFQHESGREHNGQKLRVWMENLPGIPEEPLSYPFADLSSQFMLLPTQAIIGGGKVDLLLSWESACQIIERLYKESLRGSSKVKRLAIERTSGSQTARGKVETLYRLVRDEIETAGYSGVLVDPEVPVSEILERRRGDFAEKALLLHSLLAAVKVDSDLVWMPDRRDGSVDMELYNPNWFSRVGVRVVVDGETLYLDPSDVALGTGALPPTYEGMPALVVSAKNPERVTLPTTPFHENRRQGRIELQVGEDGALSGRGDLVFTGQHAWVRFPRSGEDDEATESLQEWLAGRFPGYEVSEVEVEASADERRVHLTWALAQKEEDVLGDEVTLKLSRPVGPLRQQLPEPPASRHNPVLLAFGDRDELQVEVTWPEGWAPDVTPTAASLKNGAGELATSIEVLPDERRLVYKRRLDVQHREYQLGQEYTELRKLFDRAEKSDAETFVLVEE